MCLPYVCKCLQKPEATGFPGAGATHGCESPDIGASNQTPVFSKNRKYLN